MLIFLNGGLGNQIGNYVFGKFMAQIGADVKFVYSNAIENERKTTLENFNVNLEKATPKDIQAFLSAPSSFLLLLNLFKNLPNPFWRNNLWNFLKRIRLEYQIYPKKTPALLSKVLPYKDIQKSAPEYQAAVGDCYSPIEEFYAQNFREEIIKEITLKTPLAGENLEMAQKIEANKNSVGIHIRRGDYLKFKFPVVKKEYLIEKINYLAKTLENPEFYVFSNGMDWAREALDGLPNVTFVEINGEENGYLDFALFTKCRHRIYSNSTFSLWAKYLNQNENSIEFLPEKKDLETP